MISDDRVERVLILLLLQEMKGATQREKVRLLNLAGLANSEIAEYLETSPQVVAQYIYEARKAGKTGSRRKRKAKAS